MSSLVETPFKLTLEETLCSAAVTLCLLKLAKIGTPVLSVAEICFTPQYGFTASASSEQCGPRFVRITDIKGGFINWDTVPFCECADPSSYELEDGDIIIARSGSVGKSFLISFVPEIAVFASYMIRLRAKPNFTPLYIYWCLQSQQFWQQIMETQRGSAMKNINGKMLSSLKFPMPSQAIQDAIADFLSTFRVQLRREEPIQFLPHLPSFLSEEQQIVARIEELATRIEEARGLRLLAANEVNALVLSFLSRLFDYNKGDKLPTNWTWQSLSDLLITKKEGITTGPFGTLLQKSDIQSEGVPVLGIANVQANRFIPGFSDYINLSKADSLSSYRLEANDIVIARSGTVGRSCVVPVEIDPTPIMSTNLMRLRLKLNIFLPELLCRLFNGSRLIERFKDAECRGSTRAFFTQHILLKLQLPVPPLSEQLSIVAFLDNLQSRVDALKQIQSEASAELDVLLPSILDKAFKGEL